MLAALGSAVVAAADVLRVLSVFMAGITTGGMVFVYATIAPVMADWTPEQAWQLHAAISRLLTPPPRIDISSVRRRLVPVSEFLTRFRDLLRERRGFAFEEAVQGLDRLGQATALLAVLELYKSGEAVPVQDELFGPIAVTRASARPVPVSAPEEPEERAIA